MIAESGMSVRRLTACAVMTALLLAVQFALSFVVGVELVSALLLTFCYVYGAACGMLTATAFSLVRCLLFGFSPTALILYLVYFNLFALVFGLMGKRGFPPVLSLLLLAALSVAAGTLAARGLPISVLYRRKMSVMLWIMCGITAAIAVMNVILLAVKRGEDGRRLCGVTALAAFMTVCFTLLDDVITPLFYGWSSGAAVAYFYAGFLAMIPHVTDVTVTTLALFLPLERLLRLFARR